jgi:hypothetical protein
MRRRGYSVTAPVKAQDKSSSNGVVIRTEAGVSCQGTAGATVQTVT